MSRKQLSGLSDARRKGGPIEPKDLYDRHRHTVSRRGDNASAADHLWMVCGDRRLEHSVLGELAGRSCGRCSRIPRLHAEQVAQQGRLPVATNRSTMPLPWGGQFENHRAMPWILPSFTNIGVAEWTPFFTCHAHRSLMPRGSLATD